MFAVGDFVEYSDSTTREIGEIDDILVHELTRSRRLFVRISKVRLAHEADTCGARDRILDLPHVVFTGDFSIIGLSAIQSRKLYIVQIGDNLVWNDWTLQFL